MTGLGHSGVGEGADGLAHIGMHISSPESHRQRLSQPSSIQSPSFIVMLSDMPWYTHSETSAVMKEKVYLQFNCKDSLRIFFGTSITVHATIAERFLAAPVHAG